MADNACVGFKRTITEIEENNIEETTQQQQQQDCKVSFLIDSSSKDQTTLKKVKSSPFESLSNIQELGFHHQVDLVSVPANNQEILDTVRVIAENLGGKFENAEILDTVISLEQNQEMVDAAVCENVGAFCDVMKDTEISHNGFDADFESKEVVVNSSVECVQEMVDAAVCEKVGTFGDVMKETEISHNGFVAKFETKNRSVVQELKKIDENKNRSVVQELKKIDENKNRVGKMEIRHVTNGGIGISSSLRFDFNKQLLSQFEVGSSVFGDITRVNKVSGYPKRSAINLKKNNSGQEMYKNVQNKHCTNSSLKIEVIDDTALIKTILHPKNGNNRYVKRAERISLAKGKEKIGKKIEKQEADCKKPKQLRRNNARVPKKTRQVYIRVEPTKRIYSREKLMALKDIDVVEQQKTWTSIRNGLNPDVANEYDTLVVDEKQQKDSSLEFYHRLQNQFRNRGQLPGLLGVFARRGRGNRVNVLAH